MNSYHMNSQNVNFINKNPRKNISMNQVNNKNKYNYGEKIKEKNNYTLYVSGFGYSKPHYEKGRKGTTQFKLVKNKNNIQKYLKNKQSLYNDLYRPKNDQILTSSTNYGFKETKDLKEENPNPYINVQENYISNQQNTIDNFGVTQNLKNIKEENNERIIINNMNNNLNRNIHYRILNLNKSSDNIIRKNKQKINKESFLPKKFRELVQEKIENDICYINTDCNNDYKPKKNYENKKHIKSNNIPYYNYIQNLDIYRKNIKRESSYQNVQNNPIYYVNEGDEDVNYYEQNNNNNQYISLKNRKMNRYDNYDEIDENIDDDYEYQKRIFMNYRENERKKKFEKRNLNEFFDFGDIKGIKNIQCPLHGNISIIIHKKPYNNI